MGQVIFLFLIHFKAFHKSKKLRQYFKNNDAKVVFNATKNPTFAGIELFFNVVK